MAKTTAEETPIMRLTQVKELRPKYLNQLRNTPHYQSALAHGVQTDSGQVQITPRDILHPHAEGPIAHVFPNALKSNNVQPYVLTQPKSTQEINFLNGIYRSATMRVVGFQDKIKLARTVNPEAYSDPYSEEVIFAYAAALERLHTFDRTLDSTQNDKTYEEREWCIGTLTDFLLDSEGLDARQLWSLYRGKGEPRIKSVKTSRAAYENILKRVLDQREKLNRQLGEIRARELDDI